MMDRALRITFSGALYHVTSRENKRKAGFKSKRECNWFSPRMARNAKMHLCKIETRKKIKRFGSQESARRSATHAASDALDPFHFDVDLDCEDE
jgi:hypothetical protein